MTQPVRCRRGEFAASAGEPECKLCPVGSYQPAEASSMCLECEEVLAGSTTANLASSSSEACICPAGSYKPLEQDACITCLVGMVCPEGSDERNLLAIIANTSQSSSSSSSSAGPFPVPLKGYMARAARPLEVCCDVVFQTHFLPFKALAEKSDKGNSC